MDHASRMGGTRNECDPQAHHRHSPHHHSQWAQYLVYRTEPNFGRRWALRSWKVSFPCPHAAHSSNRKIELFPLCSPHRRLQLMIRAPGLLHIHLAFTSTMRGVNQKKMCLDTGSLQHATVWRVLTSLQASLVYIPRATCASNRAFSYSKPLMSRHVLLGDPLNQLAVIQSPLLCRC